MLQDNDDDATTVAESVVNGGGESFINGTIDHPIINEAEDKPIVIHETDDNLMDNSSVAVHQS